LQSAAAVPGGAGARIVVRAFDETTQPDFLGFFSTQIAKADGVVALVGQKGSGQLIFSQHTSAGKDMNALLKRTFEKFAGKGGGNRDFARGRIADGAQVEQALQFASGNLQEQSQASAG
jgi:alanyl-tRNA synthetase